MTFGEPSGERLGAGQAGEDSSIVLPIAPGNGVPSSYSISSDILETRFDLARLPLGGGAEVVPNPGTVQRSRYISS